MTFWEEYGQQLIDFVKSIIDAILKFFGVGAEEEETTAAE